MLCLHIGYTFKRGRQMLNFLWVIYGIFSGRHLTKQRTQCLQENNKLYEGVGLSDLPLNTEIIKQTHELMMEGEKDVLVGEYRKSVTCIYRLSYFCTSGLY